MPRINSNRRSPLRLLFLLIILIGLSNGDLVVSAVECGVQGFKATTNYNLSSGARSLALGDFDGNGSLDLVFANHASDYISISLNDGKGMYSVPVSYPVKSGPHFIITGDFNADGRLDIATSGYNNNIGSTTGLVSVLLGDGTGGFGQLTSYSVGAGPNFMAAADLNKDSYPDLVTANSDNSNLSVLFGNGAGGFGVAVNVPLRAYPQTVAISDFNKDGNLDLVVGHYANNNVSLLLGTGSGSFGSPKSIRAAAESSSAENVALGDFNGDGNTDLAVGLTSNYPIGISILLGNGAGSFGAPTLIPMEYPGYVVVGDLNGDGKQDLVGLNGEQAFHAISVFFGNGLGGFSDGRILAVGRFPTHAAIGDLNQDGKNDLAVTNAGSSDFSILLGDGAGNLGTMNYPEEGIQATYTVSGDFNSDNKPDVAVANSFSNDVSILLGDGTGVLGAPSILAVGFRPESIATGDFNGDGRLDLAVGNNSNGLGFSNVSILLGDGAGGFGVATNYPLGSQSQTQSVATGDLNSDGKLDLVTANKGSSTVTILIGNGAGGFGAPKVITIGSNATFVALSDFNGDSHLDMAVANGSIGQIGKVSILLGNGGGGFKAATNFVVGAEPYFIAAADLNGDGKMDLATANHNPTVSILLGNGVGGFDAASSFGTGPGTSLAIKDFNGDGKHDLAVANSGFSGGPVSIFLGDGAGKFSLRRKYIPDLLPLSLAADDFNGDGRPDLAVANYNSATVSILLNQCLSLAAPKPSLTINNAIVTEGVTGSRNAVFTVTLSAPTSRSVTVNFSTLADSAKPVTDFGALQGQLTFAPGETTKTITVLVGGDRTWEQDEYFSVKLSSPVNATLKRSRGLGAILNDDPIPTISITDLGAIEGNSGINHMTFNVTLSNPTSQQVSIQYKSSEETASQTIDYASVSGTLQIAPGNTSSLITVPVYGDTLDEDSETFAINLSNAIGATFAKAQAVGFIHDDDPPPSIRINDASITEGNNGTANLILNVNLSMASGKTVTVNYSTADSTAQVESDYQQVTGTLIFAQGETGKTIVVPVNSDAAAEIDETFFVNLSTPLNATIADGQCVCTIINDDGTPLRLILDESGPAPSQAAALDSILFLRDPFMVRNAANLLNQSTDRNTRVIVFVTGLQLAQSETASSVIVNLTDSNNQSYAIAAEDVRLITGFHFTQVTFRLPDNLAPGTCSIKVKAHGQESNTGTIRIKR